MWQEQWEATQSNLKKYDVHPKKQLPSGHTLPWRTWRTANRVRSGQAATPAAKHLWGYRESETCVCGAATCDLGHIMTNCRHFGERPNRDEIAGMEDRAVRWMDAVAYNKMNETFLYVSNQIISYRSLQSWSLCECQNNDLLLDGRSV